MMSFDRSSRRRDVSRLTAPRLAVSFALVGLSAAGCASDAPSGPPLDPNESLGCAEGAALYGAGTTTASIEHDGLTRTFRVHVPPGVDGSTPVPIVLMFHGGGGSGQQLENASSQMDQVADREGFITVYPDGTGSIRTWNGGGCCGSAAASNVDDVGFVDALLDHLGTTTCHDRRRVYASGMSNGAILSHRLGCELADRIAAIAPVSGTDMTASCTPSRPVPTMQIHGTEDGHVPWDGGVGCGPSMASFTSVPTTIDRWRTRNACSSGPTAYFAQGDGQCDAYGACAGAADVVLCAIDGGGHSWPGGAPNVGVVDCPADGAQSTTFDASEAIWSFFDAHPRASF